MERMSSDPDQQAAWRIDTVKKARIEAWVPNCFQDRHRTRRGSAACGFASFAPPEGKAGLTPPLTNVQGWLLPCPTCGATAGA